MPTLTREIIEAAIAGFEAQKQNIDAQIADLRSMLSGSSASSAPSTTTKRGAGKRRLSPEALERIREGQRRRWAAARGGSAAAPAKAAKKAKRKLSPEGRKAIVAALKKRWAAKKAAATE
jgi:hypothetical protein